MDLYCIRNGLGRAGSMCGLALGIEDMVYRF